MYIHTRFVYDTFSGLSTSEVWRRWTIEGEREGEGETERERDRERERKMYKCMRERKRKREREKERQKGENVYLSVLHITIQ